MLYFCAIAISSSVQAQNNPKPVKFIKSQERGNFEFPGKGKPFIPNDVEQSIKPNESISRGIPDGYDDRILMTSNKYPWSTIGRVEGTTANAKSYHCTGTLIHDNLVLTNSHCVIDPETDVLSKEIKFLPNFINGRVSNPRDIASVEKVVYGTDFKNGNQDNAKDWAILVLDKPLGRKYGYLGWKSIPPNILVRNKNAFFFVGYSGDFPKFNPGMIAGFEKGCSITGEEAGLLLHDCDTAGGSSGDPIIATIDSQYYIVGVNNMEFKNRRTGQDIINAAVKISTIEAALADK
ncbi:trypsin-like serine peptidase [Rivularia sp. UHCC 0363]|uniref:trypsin-like serine peptidase n=1 Tax=Rivularia sp. UHCC 0363 TaxID=3110244 RepID=UPI002B1F7EE1|nr:trypsin-like peptidase domain-containing protein [Rivularia sp. UHCC 0363]MEA5596439.1 trypsin-like peptidase domain-containing protein [Rivularia sp. UHCC 0363]